MAIAAKVGNIVFFSYWCMIFYSGKPSCNKKHSLHWATSYCSKHNLCSFNLLFMHLVITLMYFMFVICKLFTRYTVQCACGSRVTTTHQQHYLGAACLKATTATLLCIGDAKLPSLQQNCRLQLCWGTGIDFLPSPKCAHFFSSKTCYHDLRTPFEVWGGMLPSCVA